MLGAWKYGLRNLRNLNGRDGRQTFWYFIVLIFVIRMVLGFIIAVPMVANMFAAIFDAAKSNADPAALQAKMMGSMTGMMSSLMWAGIAVAVVTGALVLPGLVRRLHDSDMSGWWAALPAMLEVTAMSQAPEQMKRMVEIMATMDPANPPNSFAIMRDQGLIGLLSYVALGLLIWFGVRKSTDGPNRYGDAPVMFR